MILQGYALRWCDKDAPAPDAVDLAGFEKNPIVTDGFHMDRPIGRATVVKDDIGLLATVTLDSLTPDPVQSTWTLAVGGIGHPGALEVVQVALIGKGPAVPADDVERTKDEKIAVYENALLSICDPEKVRCDANAMFYVARDALVKTGRRAPDDTPADLRCDVCKQGGALASGLPCPECGYAERDDDPPYMGDEPLGTCVIHGDYWTPDCTRCGR